jgi:hypothetical protein
MSERPQDWRNTPGQPVASTRETAARDNDNACGVGVRRSLYDQGPISGDLPAGTVLQVRNRNCPYLSIEISIGEPP